MLCGDAMSRVVLDQLDPSWGTFSLGSLGDVAFATREMLANVCDNNLPTLVLARCCVDIINSPLMTHECVFPSPSVTCLHQWTALLNCSSFAFWQMLHTCLTMFWRQDILTISEPEVGSDPNSHILFNRRSEAFWDWNLARWDFCASWRSKAWIWPSM